jgi:hypothetical protein
VTGNDAFYATGGDLARAVNNSVSRNPHDYLTKIVNIESWSEEKARYLWAAADPMTWAGRIRGKKILFINAEYDLTFRRQPNYEKLLRAMGPGNVYNQQWLPVDHDPTRRKGTIYLGLNLLRPMIGVVESDVPKPNYICRVSK